MATAVFGIATKYSQADVMIEALKGAGFANNDISVLFSDQEGTRDFAHEKNTKAPEGAITGASTGGVVGGVLGWLAGIGSLAMGCEGSKKGSVGLGRLRGTVDNLIEEEWARAFAPRALSRTRINESIRVFL